MVIVICVICFGDRSVHVPSGVGYTVVFGLVKVYRDLAQS